MRQHRYRWISPTLCGCVVRVTNALMISLDTWKRLTDFYPDQPGMVEHFLCHIEEQGLYDAVITDYRFLECCSFHSALPEQVAIADLRRWCQTTLTFASCGCSVCYYYDRNTTEDERVHYPIEHPLNTKRCVKHQHLSQPEIHYEEALKGSQRVEARLEWAAGVLGIDKDNLCWSLDPARRIRINGFSIKNLRAMARRKRMVTRILAAGPSPTYAGVIVHG